MREFLIGVLGVFAASFSAFSGEKIIPVGSELFKLVCGKRSACKAADFTSHKSAIPRKSHVVTVSPEGVETEKSEVYLVIEMDKAEFRKVDLKKLGVSPYDDFTIEVINENLFKGSLIRPGHSTGTSFQISPLQAMSYAKYSGPGMGNDDYSTLDWSWDTFSGRGAFAPESWGAEGKKFHYRDEYLLFPFVQLDPTYLKSGWKGAVLGSCSLSLGPAGFSLKGKAPDELNLRALLISDRVLQIDLPERAYKTGSKNWLNDDHLEIWQEVKGGELRQWGIRISDGKVFKGYGEENPAPSVSREVKTAPDSSRWIGLKIELPFPVNEKFSVSFSAGGEGEKVKYLNSSSQVRYGDQDSLSLIYKPEPRYGTCRAEKGFLQFQRSTLQ